MKNVTDYFLLCVYIWCTILSKAYVTFTYQYMILIERGVVNEDSF